MRNFICLGVTLFWLVCSSAVNAAGPTYIKDPIAVSTTWAAANSPFIVQNDIVIAKGAILTLEPGVEVRFTVPTSGAVGAGPNIVVEGGIKAVGNATAPISFNPETAGS